ncbi:MAG: ABC transporter permease [Taibaiella sp.]|nr:ABC transporter permease [Taibaiella sp.]
MNTSAASVETDKWDVVISPKSKVINFNFAELWKYRDLLMMFVRKDIVTVYKQTILGPIWFVVQPIMTTMIYYFIFGRVAKLGTDNVPAILFYLGSNTLWLYFSETLNTTSKTFADNASIFGKVYFPRLLLPLSKVISGMIKLFIQLILFVLVLLYYIFVRHSVMPNQFIFLFPFLLVLMAALSFALGTIITSMTTKYRDMTFLVTFGVQLLMYATPVIYPVSKFKEYQTLIWLNPLTSIFETFKYGFYGKGSFSWGWLGYTVLFTVTTTIVGMVVFNNVEKKFIDTV